MKPKTFLYVIMLIFLPACQPTSVSIQPVRSSSGQSSSNSSQDTSSFSTDTVKKIPYSRETPPSGILDQLGWGGKGGPVGWDDWTPYRPTSNCVDCSVEFHNNRIILSGFDSSQTVFIPIYVDEGKYLCVAYITYVKTTVNASGSRIIQLTGNTDVRLVISGVYDYYTGDLLVLNVTGDGNGCSEQDYSETTCPGAPTQRLTVGGEAYVCTASDTVRLREGAGTQYGAIKNLVTGTELDVIGGPRCSNSFSWWQVRTESGFTGWMAEGGDNIDPYFLCPQ